MARVVTYHPTLKQLVYSPAPEYDKLHGATLAKLGPSSLSANKPLSLGNWAPGAGNSSDILVSFSRPTTTCKLGMENGFVCVFSTCFQHSSWRICHAIVYRWKVSKTGAHRC